MLNTGHGMEGSWNPQEEVLDTGHGAERQTVGRGQPEHAVRSVEQRLYQSHLCHIGDAH